MRSRHPRRVGAAGVLVMIALTGCGPTLRDQAGIAQVATGVRYGGTTPTPSPTAVALLPPASNPFSGYPPLITVPAPVLVPAPATPPPSPTPLACPTAGVLEGPVSAATPTVPGPPAAATYTYRDSGSETFSTLAGALITRTTVGPSSSVQVVPGSTDTTGVNHFTLTDSSQHVSATTSFATQNGAQAPSLPQQLPSPAPQQASTGYVEVTGTSQTDAGGTSSASFEQGNGLELLELPGQAGSSWSSDPTDPSVATGGPQSWQFQGWVGDGSTPKPGTDRVSVDACGTVLQGWQVTLHGTITAPSLNLTVDATYVIGTQYGGIPLLSHVHRFGTENGQKYDYEVTEVIAQAPATPGGA